MTYHAYVPEKFDAVAEFTRMQVSIFRARVVQGWRDD